MRIVFAGASSVVAMATRELRDNNHEVVIIERDEKRIAELSETLDCGFIHGDASHPPILAEVSPENTSVLACMTDNDQVNIISSLVAKSMGFERVVTKIENPEFERICSELGLKEVICPDLETAKNLTDLLRDYSTDLSVLFAAGLRIAVFPAGERHQGPTKDLDLPEQARVVALIRDHQQRIVGDSADIRADDMIVVLCPEADLQAVSRELRDG